MCGGNPDGAIGVFGGVPGRLVAKKSRPIVAGEYPPEEDEAMVGLGNLDYASS